MLKRRNIVLLIFIMILVSFLISYIFFKGFDYQANCGDGSSFESCSSMKPYYCNSFGQLVSRASVCGCDENFTLKGNSCYSEYYNGSFSNNFKYVLNGENGRLRVVLYEGVMDYLDSLPKGLVLLENETVSRKDFKSQKINPEVQIEALKHLIVEIQNTEKNKDMQAKIAISLVQNIPYSEPEEIPIFGGRFFGQVSRYPYEVLYDKAGWCEGKSDLMVLLLRELGFSTGFFYFPENNHEAVGIACPKEYSFRNTGYCFVETTGPSMISYSEGPYDYFFELSEDFELVEFSNGTFLSRNIEDYGDAKSFSRINNKLSNLGAISNYDKLIYENIKEKYGMS
jgi:hypothetical protein